MTMLYCNKAIISCATAILSLCSCASGDGDSLANSGHIGLSLQSDITISQITTRSTKPYMPVLESLTADKLAISLTNKSGSYSATWQTRSEFPAEKDFPADTYTMRATFGNTDAEGFESPQLYGEATFPVIADKTTSVELTATVANSLVMFDPTEEFLDYFQSVRFVLNSAAGNSIVVNPGETRPVYINPGDASIDARVILPSGTDALISIGSFTAKKAILHRIGLDVEAKTGTATLTITFDESLTDAEPIKIELSEALFTSPAPVVTPEGFIGGETIELLETYVDGDYAFNIATRAGLRMARLMIDSDESIPEMYDLLNRRDLETIEQLGLRTINMKENAEFSKVILDDFLASLRCEDRDNISSKKITLSIIDRLGRSTDLSLADYNTLAVNLTPLKISLKATDDIVVNPTYQIIANYNGRDFENKIKFQTVNKNGQTVSVNPSEITKSDNEGEYLLTFSTPRLTPYFNIYGNIDNIYASDEIFVPQFQPSIPDRDKWATHATLTIMPDSTAKYGEIIGKNIRLSGSGQISPTDNPFVFEISGLEPGKQHTIQSSLNNLNIQSSTFTTEQALQLPNPDMEIWSENEVHKYWKRVYPGPLDYHEWATVNIITTSEGGDNDNALSGNRNAFAYNAISGTISTDDCYSGEKAALIRTVGWGAGNSAAASSWGSGFGTCKNVTAGELFLGTLNPVLLQPVYSGLDFTSRPSNLEFYYKYQTVTENDDFAEVEIVLYDISGDEIAKEYKKLERADSYTPVTVNINYPEEAPKASNIMIRFKSSGNPAACTANSTYMTPPPPMDRSNGQYMGSQLYIDEIRLNY